MSLTPEQHTDFSVTHTLHFRDARLPDEMRFEMERRLMILFASSMEAGRLRMSCTGTIVGAAYTFDLFFDSIEASEQRYTFGMSASWSGFPATHHDYYRRSADSWFAVFSGDLMPADPPELSGVPSDRYRSLCEAALHAEDHLDNAEAIQQAIVAAIKQGSFFSSSHKEGGSQLCCRDGRFIRDDYGEDPAHLVYPNEADFLTALRYFCNMQITHRASSPLTDLETWKLILRSLETR